MATNYSDAETEDNYLETKNEDSPPISSSKSKRGREEYEKCSLEINEESKKYKKKSFHWNWTDECTVLENFYEFAGKKKKSIVITFHLLYVMPKLLNYFIEWN